MSKCVFLWFMCGIVCQKSSLIYNGRQKGNSDGVYGVGLTVKKCAKLNYKGESFSRSSLLLYVVIGDVTTCYFLEMPAPMFCDSVRGYLRHPPKKKTSHS